MGEGGVNAGDVNGGCKWASTRVRDPGEACVACPLCRGVRGRLTGLRGAAETGGLLYTPRRYSLVSITGASGVPISGSSSGLILNYLT